jgi:glycosyltransferase involved in cell wall biosynthesis
VKQVIHITEEYSPEQYGLTSVINQLTNYLAEQRFPTTVLSAGPVICTKIEGVTYKDFSLPLGCQTWRYPAGMKKYLENMLNYPGNLLHLHGVWKAPQWLASRVASRYRSPVILTPHNMLASWLWSNGKCRWLKKSIYWQLLAYPTFRHLSMIHAFTTQEYHHLSRLFPEQPIVVIPNAIDVEKVEHYLTESEKDDPLPIDFPYLLFVGRLHPVKGVDILIKAFARCSKHQNFKLLIVGPDSTPAYTADLKSLVQNLNMEEKVIFYGPSYGNKKYQLFRKAWACCAPSHTEVIGQVNLECASAGIPVITTYETGLDDWEKNGGILIHPNVEELAKALEQVFSWSESERNGRGNSLRQLVRQRYCWEVVGPQWIELYSSLL